MLHDCAALEHGSTVPSRVGQPSLPATREILAGSLGLLFLGEQAVDSRPRARNVGPKGPELLQLVCERRRRQVVRRQGGDVSSTEGSLERGAPLAEPIGSRDGLIDTRS